MDNSKTYFIELISAQDGKLINKFKFILAAKKVSELKDLIQQKLNAKGSLTPDQKITIKDVDDFELASDDEVDAVIADGKIKVYVHTQKSNNIQSSTQIIQSNASIPAVNSSSNIKPPQNIVNIVPNKIFVVDMPVLEPKAFPIVANDHPKEWILKAKFPQIRKAPYLIGIHSNLTYLKLSELIVNSFMLPNHLKAVIFDQSGQPLLFNLDLMNLPLPKLNLDQQFTIMLTATPSVVDKPAVLGMHSSANNVYIQVVFQNNKIKIPIDLDNNLSVLKYLIFEKTAIHPASQIIKFANNILGNELEVLKSYGIKQGSILDLTFKNIANLVPATYADKFYYKDIEHIHKQQPQSLRHLRTNLLAINRHLSAQDKIKVVSFIREYTSNNALAFAFMTMFNNVFLSQAHRIALEQGLYCAIANCFKLFNSLPKELETKNIFTAFRSFFGFVLESISKVKSDEVQLINRQKVIKVQPICYFNMKPIQQPAELTLDNKDIVIVDRILMEEQIKKGFVYETLKVPKIEMLKVTNQLINAFQIMKSNTIDNKNINVIIWKGAHSNPYFIPPASYLCSYDFYLTKIDNYPQLKVHQPLELKSKSVYYLILKNKQNELKIYVSKNKDINNPYNIYDVITGEQQAVNFDLMMGAAKTQNLQQVVDLAQIKPIITRQPKQAIAVLFDISGSMAGKFFNETDLNRIGAVKSCFEAFAYRTIAYNFEHVVSLILFDNKAEVQCDFTEAIYDFNRFVANAKPRGGTLLYDCIYKSVQQLLAFKKRYPDCLLRILALTDGEDTGSSKSVFDVAKFIVDNKIVMDSFAVGTNCVGLKNITIATGGRCYLTRNLGESLKLFEQETVLSLRARKQQSNFMDLDVEKRLQIANAKPFDLPDNVYEFKMPQVSKPGNNLKDINALLQNQQQQKKIAGSNSLKRIAKEIQNYSMNPHPFVAIFPCSNINLWKILLLGPKQTPYQNGLFLLYAEFPGDYPFRAPTIRFITPIYHCNMNAQGRICHSVFDSNYSPALTFRYIVDCIYGLILTPEPEDPLDNVVASYYLSDYPKYLANAKQSTKQKASKTTEQIVQELFGKINDDIERQKTVKQIDNWIITAKSFN